MYFDVYVESSRCPAVSPRPYAQPVDLSEDIELQLRDPRILVPQAERYHKCFFRDDRRGLEVSPTPTPMMIGGHGLGPPF